MTKFKYRITNGNNVLGNVINNGFNRNGESTVTEDSTGRRRRLLQAGQNNES